MPEFAAINWEEFLEPYRQAVDELKIKFRAMRRQFEIEGTHSSIEFVTSRVKPVPSIIDKAKRKNLPPAELDKLYDIAGVRIMCPFVEDIWNVVNLLRNRNDFTIVEEKDYISHKKESGYRSYHVIILYPVQTIHGEKKVLAEIQIRTLAMNFWATIEHSLSYKYQEQIPEEIAFRLRRAAEAAYLLDEEMSQIREEIKEAQKVFTEKKLERK